MRIGLICTCLTHGGAEHCAALWANGFRQRGHEVLVITNLFEPITFPLDKDIEVRQLVSTNRNKLKKWASSFGNARKCIKEFHPNVIIGVMETCSLIAKIASLGLHIPVIATEHNSFERPHSAPFGFWDRVSKFFLNKLYKNVTVLTKEDKRVIGHRLKKIHVMPNPLALEHVQSIPSKEKIILAAGRLDGWHVKGFDVLIKAWGYLMKNEECRMKNLNWRLQIAGSGSEESLEYLKNLCKENGVEDSVDFLGFVSNMESLYKKASVFVLSSRYEGFGLVLIEAMSQGCACIACDYKGRQREIMCPDEQELGTSELGTSELGTPELGTPTGILCPPDDVKALADAMRKMMEDDEYRESVRGNAVERSKYYSIENTIARWEILLNSIVNKK